MKSKVVMVVVGPSHTQNALRLETSTYMRSLRVTSEKPHKLFRRSSIRSPCGAYCFFLCPTCSRQTFSRAPSGLSGFSSLCEIASLAQSSNVVWFSDKRRASKLQNLTHEVSHKSFHKCAHGPRAISTVLTKNVHGSVFVMD